MVRTDNPISSSLTKFVPGEIDSTEGCMLDEMPASSTITNDNISSTLSTNANKSKEQSAPWVEIDLGAQKEVCGVNIQFKEGGDEVKFFTIELSKDGKSFTLPKYYSNTGSGSGGEIFNLGRAHNSSLH